MPRAVPFDKVVELGSMMRKVVEEGTGKRAQLGEGITVIGRPGPPTASRTHGSAAYRWRRHRRFSRFGRRGIPSAFQNPQPRDMKKRLRA
jgi:hypothetical protein